MVLNVGDSGRKYRVLVKFLSGTLEVYGVWSAKPLFALFDHNNICFSMSLSKVELLCLELTHVNNVYYRAKYPYCICFVHRLCSTRIHAKNINTQKADTHTQRCAESKTRNHTDPQTHILAETYTQTHRNTDLQQYAGLCNEGKSTRSPT